MFPVEGERRFGVESTTRRFHAVPNKAVLNLFKNILRLASLSICCLHFFCVRAVLGIRRDSVPYISVFKAVGGNHGMPFNSNVFHERMVMESEVDRHTCA